MSISFNEVPNTRVPFFYAEFDSSKANQGPALQPFTALIIGQMIAGEGAPETLYPITSDEEAIRLFGNGSQIVEMIKKFRIANTVTLLKAIALDDDAAGVPAAGSVDFLGAATKNGTRRATRRRSTVAHRPARSPAIERAGTSTRESPRAG